MSFFGLCSLKQLALRSCSNGRWALAKAKKPNCWPWVVCRHLKMWLSFLESWVHSQQGSIWWSDMFFFEYLGMEDDIWLRKHGTQIVQCHKTTCFLHEGCFMQYDEHFSEEEMAFGVTALERPQNLSTNVINHSAPDILIWHGCVSTNAGIQDTIKLCSQHLKFDSSEKHTLIPKNICLYTPMVNSNLIYNLSICCFLLWFCSAFQHSGNHRGQPQPQGVVRSIAAASWWAKPWCAQQIHRRPSSAWWAAERWEPCPAVPVKSWWRWKERNETERWPCCESYGLLGVFRIEMLIFW